MQEQMIDAVVREVLASLGQKSSPAQLTGGKVGVADYPLATRRPDLVKSPTGKSLSDITLAAVTSGKITSQDVRISPETLEMQAQIAESAGRPAFARNLRRAAEMIAVPDERILEIYNAMRPNRSTKAELLAIADELLNQYNARTTSAFVRESAEVYESRGCLRKD